MATQLCNDIMIVEGDLTSNSSTPQTTVGSRAVSPEGRIFRYAKAGGVALVPGTLLQSPVEDTGVENLAVAASAIGSTTITTTSTVTVTANQYAGGWAVITTSTGAGYTYKIKSHPAATGAVVVLTLEDPIQVALTTSSKVDLVANPYNGVIINPTTATGVPIGVAVYPISIGYYGWIQVGGPTTVLADGTVTVGTSVVASNGTAGAVEAATGVQAPVGIAMEGIATTEYGMIKLSIE